jgi:hypothetical protein
VGNSAGEALLFKVLKTSGIIWKLAVKIHDRVAEVLRDCLVAVHTFHLQTVCHLFYVM